jgi:hypothetical protein
VREKGEAATHNFEVAQKADEPLFDGSTAGFNKSTAHSNTAPQSRHSSSFPPLLSPPSPSPPPPPSSYFFFFIKKK